MTADGITIETLEAGREAEAEALVLAVFDAKVAPGFSPQGRDAFYEFIRQSAFSRRPGDGFALAALHDDRVVGVIEVVDGSHVALLFVSTECQGMGIGQALMHKAEGRCRENNRGLAALTVNSSPNAVEAYRRMGFTPLGEEQERDGIRFVPMTKPLS